MVCRLVAVSAWGALAAQALVAGPWSDRNLPALERAIRLVQNMSLAEKISTLHGPATGPTGGCKSSPDCAYVGNVKGIERLDTPPLTLNDGPQGFRTPSGEGTSTSFPSGLTIAASFDVEAAREWGSSMGKEFYDKGSNIQLGPGLCLARVPLNGRNFEYLAGEDPYLGSAIAKAAVEGIQSQKVVANAKHWVLNSQETARGSVSEDADERTRYELYYPPFEGAVAGGVGSAMCSYNKINGVFSCENKETLRDLKEGLGFTGFVMSDWGATHSPSLAQGLDMEMPAAAWMNEEMLKPALDAGVVTEEKLDEAVVRIFRPLFEVGVMDEPTSTWDWKKINKNVTTAASIASARKLSALSTVLLKNERGVLPLPRGKSLALLGFAGGYPVTHGGGSGAVTPSHVTWPLQGIERAAGDTASVHFDDGTNLTSAAALAASADYAVVFVGTTSHEAQDRVSLSLDDGCDDCRGNKHQQNKLVEVVAQANRNCIVVASVPGHVLMPWSEDVPAILVNFMPGQEVGSAIADVLFGDVNPTARLPLTFPRRVEDTELSPAQYPGLPDPRHPDYNYYTEKLLVGYRLYDAHRLQPLFPFGHGLSYTSFAYSDLAVRGTTVSFSVENSGKVAGAEVAQLYLGFPESAGEPPLQLKAFRKTQVLKPGEREAVEIQLSLRDLSVWCSKKHSWTVAQGTFKVMIGASSRDLRLHGELNPTMEQVYL